MADSEELQERWEVLWSQGRELKSRRERLLAAEDMDPELYERALRVLQDELKEHERELQALQAEMEEENLG